MVPSVGRGKHIWIVMETSIFGACGDIKYATSLLQDVQSFEKLKNILQRTGAGTVYLRILFGTERSSHLI